MAEITFKSAGVKTREIDLSQPARTGPVGVPAGIIGTSLEGPAFVPLTFANYGNYITTYGASDGSRFGPIAVNEWLKNARACTYMRVLGIGDGKKIDIVVCTALIPGKKAPLIVKEKMIDDMQPGSVIYDLAASQGGNAAYTKVDEIVEKNGVTILGEKNILNKLPTSASNLYAKNLFNFVLNLYDKKNNKININLEDEIINKTLVK